MATFEILLFFCGAPLSVYTFCRFIGLCNNVAKIRRALESNAATHEPTKPAKNPACLGDAPAEYYNNNQTF